MNDDGPGAVEVLEDAEAAAEGSRVTVRDIVDAVGYRSYGPIYVLIALFTMTPFWIVPGVSSPTGIILIVLAAQQLIGKRSPWLPEWILRLAVRRDRYERSLEAAKKIAMRVDRVTRQRLLFLSGEAMQRVAAAVVIMLGLTFIPLDIVPLVSHVPGVALLLIGIGMISEDGLFLLVGTLGVPVTVVLIAMVF